MNTANNQFDYVGEMALWTKRIEEGNSAYADRRYSKAEIRFSEALKQAESWPTDRSVEQGKEMESCLSKSLNNLAALYHSQGKHALAEKHYLQSLEIKKRLLGEEHSEIALTLQNLAACYCAKRKYAEAEALFKRALEIREKTVGTDHPDLITTLKNYGVLLQKLDRAEEAKEIENRVARLEEFKN